MELRDFRIDYALQALSVAVCFVLVLLPLSMVIFGSFYSAHPGEPGFLTLGNYIKIFSSGSYWRALLASIMNGSAAFVACLIGILLAWAVARTNTPLVKFFDIIIIMPIFTSPFMMAAAWILLLSPKIGSINLLLMSAFQLNSAPFDIYHPIGVVFVLGLTYAPFVYLFVSGALKSMDPSLEEAATISGAGKFTTTFLITLPVVMPAILSSFLLVFILSVGHFSIPVVLQLGSQSEPISLLIFNLISYPPIEFGTATAAGISLLFITIFGVYLQRRYSRRKEFITVRGKAVRPKTIDLGKWKYVSLSAVILYMLVAILLPYEEVFLNSISTLTHSNVLTLEHYEWLFGNVVFWSSLKNSLFISGVGGTIGILFSLILAWVVHRTRVRGVSAIDFVASFPIAIPGIVMGLALLWTWITLPLGLYGTIWILIISYVAFFLPFGMKSMSSVIVQIEKELEESARVSGASWLTTLRHVTLPLMRPGLVSGWILLFILFWREVAVAILLHTGRTMPLSVYTYELWNTVAFPLVCAVGFVLMLVNFVLVVILRRFTDVKTFMGA